MFGCLPAELFGNMIRNILYRKVHRHDNILRTVKWIWFYYRTVLDPLQEMLRSQGAAWEAVWICAWTLRIQVAMVGLSLSGRTLKRLDSGFRRNDEIKKKGMFSQLLSYYMK
jgi:hypothetical protein